MQNASFRSRRWFLGLGAAWSAALVACRVEGARRRRPSRARWAPPSARTDRGRGSRRRARFFNQNTKVPLEEASSRTPLHDTYGIITPSSLHFERHHSGVPEIDPATHTLTIHGLVDRPLVFTRRRAEAPAVGLAHSFSRVLRQQRRRMARRLRPSPTCSASTA